MTAEKTDSRKASFTPQGIETDGQGGKAHQPATVSGASGGQTHDRPPDLEMKIGKTTYRVWTHFSQTSRETLEDKIHRMLREDVRRMMQEK